MAKGCVVVAGNNAGYEEVLRERGRLSLVDPKDTTSFATRLELLLEDKALADLWRTWALTYVQQYSYERIVDQYEKMYRTALKALRSTG